MGAELQALELIILFKKSKPWHSSKESQGKGKLGGAPDLGYCPHPLTVYNRGNIQG